MPPIVTALTGLFINLGLGAAAAGWLAGFVVRMVLSLGLSALARAKAKRNEEQVGIKGQTTQTGGTDPLSFIIGRYATGGQLVTPPMSHGAAGKTPNAYYTYVVAVSDAPGVTLERLFIDGEVTTIGGPPDPDYGSPVLFKRWGYVWVKWYDGTQTTADPMLLAKYGGRAVRPWQSDMVGTGVAYAILTFKFDREIFKGFPAVRFEVGGIPLYDPRKDPAMGGTGGQSWANPATWQPTHNPVVMIYNILRGIALPRGDIYGGGWSAADLPTSNWFAAMNAADQPVALSAGGTEPRYRAGFEVAVDREPGEVIAELLKTCAGRMADVGGAMKIAVGAPGIPVKAILDEDIIITDEQNHSLFPSLAQTHNGVHATFPDPATLWESRDAPPRYDPVAEAQDGRRLTATISLPAVPYANQVQRLMVGWVNEERRFRRHQFVLPPDATILEPHDVISWTSAQNGYSAKLFELAEVVHDPVSLLQLVSLREVDPADYDWNSTLELPWVAPTPGAVLPPAQTVTSFAVSGTALDDASLTARRPALLLTWDGIDQVDVTALEYEVRRLGGSLTVSGVTTNVVAGSQIVAAGILPETVYEARARFVAPRQTLWTGWLQATTPAAYITLDDFDDVTTLFTSAGLSVPKIVSVLPPPGPARFQGELVYLTTDNKLYRWDGTGWTPSVDTADLIGDIGAAMIADGAIGARAMAIGDFSNLCQNPGFETATGWTFPALQGWAYSPTAPRTGAGHLMRAWSAGLAADSNVGNDLIIDCVAGDVFYLSAQLAKVTGAVCTSAGVRMGWLDASRTLISSSSVTALDADVGLAYGRISGNATAPAGAVYAIVQPCIVGHSAGVFHWDDIYCNRANIGRLLVDGEIIGQHISAGSVDADRLVAGSVTTGLLAAGAVKARNMTVDEALILSASEAGFSMGKTSAADIGPDGIYMGRALKAAGGTGYGFLMGTTIAGVSRYIQSGEDSGLNIVNANFFQLAATSTGSTYYNTSQTVTLAAGTKSITLELQGAGGGGSAYNSGAGGAGGTTTVALYDGATPTGQSWSVAGGAGGPVWPISSGVTTSGQGSAHGLGGYFGSTGYNYGRDNDKWMPPVAAGNGTGYGAGGGGYGRGPGPYGGLGGSAGTKKAFYAIDVSGLATPKLVITCGAGGAGAGGGGNGSGGLVLVSSYAAILQEAGVIPLTPTDSGNFTKGANATGEIFPDLGPGLWIITRNGGGILEFNVRATMTNHTIECANAQSVSFVAPGKPYVTWSSATALTLRYVFHRMKL